MASGNVFELPTNGQLTPLATARSLVEYVKEKPNAKIMCVVQDPDDSSITMAWSAMDASDLCLMLTYSRWRWEKATFEELE
jgi:hypothetical protein